MPATFGITIFIKFFWENYSAAILTILTIFTITASFEIAGRLRGGRGVFGWIGALPWE